MELVLKHCCYSHSWFMDIEDIDAPILACANQCVELDVHIVAAVAPSEDCDLDAWITHSAAPTDDLVDEEYDSSTNTWANMGLVFFGAHEERRSSCMEPTHISHGSCWLVLLPCESGIVSRFDVQGSHLHHARRV